MVPFSRRLDPEQQKPLEWIWRPMIAIGYCYHTHEEFRGMYAEAIKEEWEIDVGYCLDRWSVSDFPARTK